MAETTDILYTEQDGADLDAAIGDLDSTAEARYRIAWLTIAGITIDDLRAWLDDPANDATIQAAVDAGIRDPTRGRRREIVDLLSSDAKPQPVAGLTYGDIALFAADSAPLPSPLEHTIQDRFDTYGGKDLSQVEGLYWLQLEPFDSLVGWIFSGDYGTPIIDSAAGQFIEGLGSLRINPSGIDAYGQFVKASAISDYTQERRFTNDDFICIAVWASAIAKVSNVQIWFVTSLGNYFSFNITPTQTGMNLIKVKKSTATQVGSPNWANIISYGIFYQMSMSGGMLAFDDMRIVKADHFDDTSPNTTGVSAWRFDPGEGRHWHIHSDVPGVPYALGFSPSDN